MNDDISGSTSTTEPATDWERVRRLSDDAVRDAVAADSDVRPTDAGFWEGARATPPSAGPILRQLVGSAYKRLREVSLREIQQKASAGGAGSARDGVLALSLQGWKVGRVRR